MTIKQEDFTNRALALLLQAQGLAADYEQRGGRKKMDVVVDVEGLRVVLEAETGFHRKAQAIKDADARLRQRLATVVFAVCYPDGVTEDNLSRCNPDLDSTSPRPESRPLTGPPAAWRNWPRQCSRRRVP